MEKIKVKKDWMDYSNLLININQSILNKGLVRKKRLDSIKSREENGYKITEMKLEFIKI